MNITKITRSHLLRLNGIRMILIVRFEYYIIVGKLGQVEDVVAPAVAVEGDVECETETDRLLLLKYSEVNLRTSSKDKGRSREVSSHAGQSWTTKAGQTRTFYFHQRAILSRDNHVHFTVIKSLSNNPMVCWRTRRHLICVRHPK